MARSQRRHTGRTVHYPTKPWKVEGRTFDDGRQMYRIDPLCGEQYVYENSYSEDLPESFRYSDHQTFSLDPEDHRMCSRCQAKALHKRDGGKVGTYKISDRLDLSTDQYRRWGLTKYAGYKSVYPVIDTAVLADADSDDRIVAFIAIESGWGKAWSIHAWATGVGQDAEPRMDPGAAQRTSVSEAWTSHSGENFPRRETLLKAAGINSKEAALLLIPDMLEREQLPSHAKIVDFDRKFKETQEALAQRRRDEAAERDRIIAERNRKSAEELTEIAEALREIAETVTLTNFQRDGLMRAAKRLGIDMEVKSTMAAVMETDQKIEDLEGWTV